MRKCLGNDRGEVKLIFVFLITLAVLTAAVAGVTYLAYRKAEKEYYDNADIEGQSKRFVGRIVNPEPDTVDLNKALDEPENRAVYKKVQKLLCGRELTDEEEQELFYCRYPGFAHAYHLTPLDIFAKTPDGNWFWKDDELTLFFDMYINRNGSDLSEEEKITYPRMVFMFHLDDPEIVAKHQEYQKLAVNRVDMTYPDIKCERKGYYTFIHSFYLDGNKIIPEEVWFVESRTVETPPVYVYMSGEVFGFYESETKVVEKIKRNVPNSDKMPRVVSNASEDAPTGPNLVRYSSEGLEQAFDNFQVLMRGTLLYNSENMFHAEEKEKYLKKAEEIATEDGAYYITTSNDSDMKIYIFSQKKNIPELGGEVLAVGMDTQPLYTFSYFLHTDYGFLGKILPGFLASDKCIGTDSNRLYEGLASRDNKTSVLLLCGIAVVISCAVTGLTRVRRNRKK